jgi:transcriptional regulator with XRE-family HTH domain
MSKTTSKRWDKLREKDYREEFVAAAARRAIPFQIRAMLRQRGWTQEELARRAQLTQGAVSRAADPSYGKLTLHTIIRIAAGFDVAFIGRFVTFSDLDRYFRDEMTDQVLGQVPTFEEEDAILNTVIEQPAGLDAVALLVCDDDTTLKKRMAKATLRNATSSGTAIMSDDSTRDAGAA